MNKAQLVEVIHSITNTTKTQAEEVMEALVDSIIKTLKKGEDVAIAGVGAWSVKMRKARTARNPKTGAAVQVPATRVVKWRVAKALKDIVANNK
jgi:DNA-binding protein HU-beta